MSLALLDAMAASVCVLASDIPENNEPVQGAGYSFNYGDQSDLEHMLGFLIRNPELRRQAAVRERDRILNEFRWPHVAQLVEAACYDVLGWAPNPHRNSIRVDASVAR
jgi:glycosyltransferase involved in cell wall biosynthesis